MSQGPLSPGGGRPVARIDLPTEREFRERYFEPGTPVILTGAAAHWKGLEAWTLEGLSERIGDREVQVRHYAGEHSVSSIRFERASCSEYLAQLDEGLATDRYLAQLDIPGQLPELVPEMDSAPFLGGDSIGPYLWVGGGGHVEPLHHDFPADGLLVQVRGHKRAVLFGPDQHELLYPFSALSPFGLPYFARVNVDRPDLRRHTRFSRAEPWQASIAPGDALFLPAGWWHQVYIESEVAVSVSFGFRAPRRAWDAYYQKALARRQSRVVRRTRRVLKAIAGIARPGLG